METRMRMLVATVSMLVLGGTMVTAETYDSVSGFSKKQGPIWYYKGFDGKKYRELVFDASKGGNRWVAPVADRKPAGGSFSQMADRMHPSRWDIVREFKVPAKVARVVVKGFFHRPSGTAKYDGVIVRILRNDKVVYGPVLLTPKGQRKAVFDLELDAATGDSIYFSVNRNKRCNADTTIFKATVETFEKR